MKRIAIIASGTRGDVQPVIALGKALRVAGYGVRLVAGRGFHDWIEGHGLAAGSSSEAPASLETVRQRFPALNEQVDLLLASVTTSSSG